MRINIICKIKPLEEAVTGKCTTEVNAFKI